MFCYQCEETNKGEGCTVQGVCGKKDEVAILQDLLIYIIRGISISNIEAKKQGKGNEKVDIFITNELFSTITNTNFDKKYFLDKIREALELRNEINNKISIKSDYDAVIWNPKNKNDIFKKAREVGILSTENQDIRSLQQLLTFGIKGMAAYAHHAFELGKKDQEIFDFMQEGLSAVLKDLSADELTSLVLKCGEYGVKTLALLDDANTSTYGHPEPTEVNIGVGKNPGIF